MRVFVTGATGFIGSALIPDLIAAGHQVLGLCRSEDKAAALTAAGAEVHIGSLQDLESLKAGAAQTDATIHLAFIHDFTQMAANCEIDRRAIDLFASVLAGSDRPLLVTTGTAMANTVPGEPATEDGPTIPAAAFPRAASEELAMAAADKGINVSIVRLPQVHDTRKQGLVTYAIAVAREKGIFAYIGDGQNRWPAAHVSDVACLYRLALEKAERGAKYHAVAEEGICHRDIAETLGRRLQLPVKSIAPDEAQAHFGWLALFVGRDLPASSAKTQKMLGWHPTERGLLADLAELEV